MFSSKPAQCCTAHDWAALLQQLAAGHFNPSRECDCACLDALPLLTELQHPGFADIVALGTMMDIDCASYDDAPNRTVTWSTAGEQPCS